MQCCLRGHSARGCIFLLRVARQCDRVLCARSCRSWWNWFRENISFLCYQLYSNKAMSRLLHLQVFVITIVLRKKKICVYYKFYLDRNIRRNILAYECWSCVSRQKQLIKHRELLDQTVWKYIILKYPCSFKNVYIEQHLIIL